MRKQVKNILKSNTVLFSVVKYLQRELVTKRTDKRNYVRSKYQNSLTNLTNIIEINDLIGGLITDQGEYYLKTQDNIWLYYNFHNNKYTNGDGQSLEFQSSYSTNILEDFILSCIKDGMYYFDIGANNGYYYSLKIAKKCLGCKIYSFEPDPQILFHLKKNVEFNKIENIKIVDVALSDKDGHAMLTKDLGASGFLVLENSRNIPTVSVRCTTFDTYTSDNNISRIDLIKVDIEGGEFNFLKGAKKSLIKFRPLIIMEMTDDLLKRSGTSRKEIELLFKEIGFFISKIKMSNDVLVVPYERVTEIITPNATWLEVSS